MSDAAGKVRDHDLTTSLVHYVEKKVGSNDDLDRTTVLWRDSAASDDLTRRRRQPDRRLQITQQGGYVCKSPA